MISATDGMVGILLAGGSSKRFGADKLLHRLPDGTPIAVASATRLLAVCPHSLSVLRSGQCELRRMLIDLGVDVRVDPESERGLGSRLAYAVRATPAAAGWLVALADMPFLKTSSVQAVATALGNGAEIAAPVQLGRRGHPVGFSRRWFAELSSLQGDIGARQILDQHARSITLIDVDDPGVLLDIDTPDDLQMH